MGRGELRGSATTSLPPGSQSSSPTTLPARLPTPPYPVLHVPPASPSLEEHPPLAPGHPVPSARGLAQEYDCRTSPSLAPRQCFHQSLTGAVGALLDHLEHAHWRLSQEERDCCGPELHVTNRLPEEATLNVIYIVIEINDLGYQQSLNIQACFPGRAQTLPNATPPIGKIHLFSKIAVIC